MVFETILALTVVNTLLLTYMKWKESRKAILKDHEYPLMERLNKGLRAPFPKARSDGKTSPRVNDDLASWQKEQELK